MAKNKIKEKDRVENVAVLTLGCSKNVVDSEEFISQLKINGIKYTQEFHNADAIIINTCGFIKPAKEENISMILEACEMKKQGILKRVYVTGCLSQRYKKELEAQLPEVDRFFGVDSTEDIVTELAGVYKYDHIGNQRELTPRHYAYIKISEGCDHPCSFCAIPHIRGKHRSIPRERIIKEVSLLAENGTKEFCIVAQDTTYYGRDIYGKPALAELLADLSEIPGVEWIRLMYTYPTKFPMDVLDVINEKDNICKYVDIPLQHISDKVLRSMLRGIDGEGIRNLIAEIRNRINDVMIRTAFIVGYPNEGREEFEELKDFVADIELERVGVFTYSQEENTPAFELGDSVRESRKAERLDIIMKLQSEISLKKNEALVGKQLKIVIDGESEDYYVGRTQWDAPEVDNGVYIRSDDELNPGDFIIAEIEEADYYDLFGRFIKKV